MQLITQYDLIWLVPMLSAALGMAALLYWRERKNEFGSVQKAVLFFLRFAGLSLLFFLLLHPFILRRVKVVERPLIVFAQDNSLSVLLNSDTAFCFRRYPASVARFEQTLKEKYDVEFLAFGDKVRRTRDWDCNDKTTDISALADYIDRHYHNRNTGALVLATDGIYNRGINPLFTLDKTGIPVFCIALGDTSVKKDLMIKKIIHNKIAFKGNKIPVEINVQANGCEGEKVTVNLTDEKGKILFEKTVPVTTPSQYIKINTSFSATRTGMQYFRVNLNHLQGELTYDNNHSGFYIDILESKQKILILYHAPHPDVAAVRRSMSASGNYEIQVFPAKDFSGQAEDYNLVIFHGLPSAEYPAGSLLSQMERSGIPAFFILSADTDLDKVNRYFKSFSISGKKKLFNEAGAVYNDNFSKFVLSGFEEDVLEKFPPLSVPYGEYQTGPSFDVLFYQKIHGVTVNLPLLGVSEEEGVKKGILCGEGVWKWRLYNYRMDKNHERIDRMMRKIVQYLSLKIKKKRFVIDAKRQFEENEPVSFEARLFDENYETVTDGEIKMTVYNEKGEKFEYAFVPDNGYYKLSITGFPAGEYQYVATAVRRGKKFTEKGKFVIQPVFAEKAVSQANHHLLYRLANMTGGEVYSPEELDKLADDLLHHPEIKPVITYKKKFIELMDFLLLLSLIILLFALEWFLRKRFGGY